MKEKRYAVFEEIRNLKNQYTLLKDFYYSATKEKQIFIKIEMKNICKKLDDLRNYNPMEILNIDTAIFESKLNFLN